MLPVLKVPTYHQPILIKTFISIKTNKTESITHKAKAKKNFTDSFTIISLLIKFKRYKN